VLVSDHVVMGEHLDAYGDPARGGTVGGRQPTGPDGHWLDPLAVLAHLAAVTERVRLGTNILIAALRRPVVLAKQASTIDVLSGGRLDLGVGVGWQAEEYEAAGLDFGRRGRLLDHTLEVCRALWTDRGRPSTRPSCASSGSTSSPSRCRPGACRSG
jgi:alkanesulfonate monooxygenase SsuD/methylene tetrahydromethanopterin reductase-like flavin-dependent oxidoreductase (luciferase family)